MKLFCHLTRKGPLLEKISKHLSGHTGMGPFLQKQCHLTRKGLLQIEQTAVSSLKKQTVVSSHKKGTASQTDKDPNKIVATDHKIRVDLWNLVTTCGMALRLEILIAGGSVSHQAWSSSALKGYSNIFLLPWRLDSFCTVGDNPRQARSCSS